MNQVKKGTELGVFTFNGAAQKCVAIFVAQEDLEFDGIAIAPIIQETFKQPPKYDESETGNLI